jgi:hypothetical protein
MSEKTKKKIVKKKLMDVYGELTRPNVVVTKMYLKVLSDGTVTVEECEYEEQVSSTI